jgi:hypothetical protein
MQGPLVVGDAGHGRCPDIESRSTERDRVSCENRTQIAKLQIKEGTNV